MTSAIATLPRGSRLSPSNVDVRTATLEGEYAKLPFLLMDACSSVVPRCVERSIAFLEDRFRSEVTVESREAETAAAAADAAIAKFFECCLEATSGGEMLNDCGNGTAKFTER
jgi:transcription elongation factor